jgi:hypothetical protein
MWFLRLLWLSPIKGMLRPETQTFHLRIEVHSIPTALRQSPEHTSAWSISLDGKLPDPHWHLLSVGLWILFILFCLYRRCYFAEVFVL